MKKIFGAKKSEDPPPSIQDATSRPGTPLPSAPYLFSCPRFLISSPWLMADCVGRRYTSGVTRWVRRSRSSTRS